MIDFDHLFNITWNFVETHNLRTIMYYCFFNLFCFIWNLHSSYQLLKKCILLAKNILGIFIFLCDCCCSVSILSLLRLLGGIYIFSYSRQKNDWNLRYLRYIVYTRHTHIKLLHISIYNKKDTRKSWILNCISSFSYLKYMLFGPFSCSYKLIYQCKISLETLVFLSWQPKYRRT